MAKPRRWARQQRRAKKPRLACGKSIMAARLALQSRDRRHIIQRETRETWGWGSPCNRHMADDPCRKTRERLGAHEEAGRWQKTRLKPLPMIR